MGRYTSGSINRRQPRLDPIAFTRHWIQRAPETTTMKLRHFSCFIAAAEQASLGRTAYRLRVSGDLFAALAFPRVGDIRIPAPRWSTLENEAPHERRLELFFNKLSLLIL